MQLAATLLMVALVGAVAMAAHGSNRKKTIPVSEPADATVQRNEIVAENDEPVAEGVAI